MSAIATRVSREGTTVTIDLNWTTWTLTAQEAYDLHQAIGAILSQCVQPFKAHGVNLEGGK